jgi:hypothetical protein
MPTFPTAKDAAKAAVQEVVDLVAVDGLPESPLQRREILRFLSQSDTWIPTHCPETGVDLSTVDIVSHAVTVWPPHIPSSQMSTQAMEREAAVYRAANAKPPVRR